MFVVSKEVLNGFEPMIRELQSHALPLGYSTISYIYCCACLCCELYAFDRHKQ